MSFGKKAVVLIGDVSTNSHRIQSAQARFLATLPRRYRRILPFADQKDVGNKLLVALVLLGGDRTM